MVKFESEHLSDDDDFGYYASDLYPTEVLCFVKAHDETIHAIIHCCIASDHSKDSILVEHWKKEYKVENNVFVPFLSVSVDTFDTPCFVVEDKHGLNEEMGSDIKKSTMA